MPLQMRLHCSWNLAEPLTVLQSERTRCAVHAFDRRMTSLSPFVASRTPPSNSIIVQQANSKQDRHIVMQTGALPCSPSEYQLYHAVAAVCLQVDAKRMQPGCTTRLFCAAAARQHSDSARINFPVAGNLRMNMTQACSLLGIERSSTKHTCIHIKVSSVHCLICHMQIICIRPRCELE